MQTNLSLCKWEKTYSAFNELSLQVKNSTTFLLTLIFHEIKKLCLCGMKTILQKLWGKIN